MQIEHLADTGNLIKHYKQLVVDGVFIITLISIFLLYPTAYISPKGSKLGINIRS